MADLLNHALFGVYPYVALVVLIVGSVLRFDTDQYGWRSKSSQMLRTRQFRLGSNLFHVGVLVILAGHIVGLLTPVEVFHALGISSGFKQVMAATVGGLAGLAAWAGLAILVHRRLGDPRIRATSSVTDHLVLCLLWLQLTLGLISVPFSLQHPDGGEMVKFMAWAQGILRLQPGAADQVAEVALVFKLHLVLGTTILLLTPFTRLVHVFSAPVWYLFRSWQVVRTRNPHYRRPATARAAVAAHRPRPVPVQPLPAE